MDADARVLAANAEVIRAFRQNPQTPLRSATWILPGVPHIYRGGLYTIFRIADAFSRFGGTVNRFAIMDANTDLAAVGRQIERAFPAMQFELVQLTGPEAAAHLPPTDVGICTLWTTAYALMRFNGAAAKYYLVQDYEPAFVAAGSVSALAEQTYRFGFTGLCNTLGVAAKYQHYTDWLTYFTPAVDHTQYYPLESPAPGMQLVFYGRPANDRNAFLLGIEALKRVKAEMGDDISIVSAGHPFKEADYGLQGVLKNLGLLPDIAAVADLYRRSHIGLVFMYTPHPSYQPLEFMASGCATVTNYNESTRWLLKDEANALLCASTAAAVAERILAGARDDALRARVIAGGLKTVSKLDWNQELKALYDYVRAPWPQTELIRT